jgi:SNF2 family DNA or RNA helicase
MNKELVVVIANHRKLGELLIPYVIDRIPGQSFFQLQEIVTNENIKKFQFPITDEILKLVSITSEYSEKSLFKIFSKKKNLKDFFDTLDDNIVNTQIRPYIEKRIVKVNEILVDSNVLLFKKDKNYQVVHDEELISVSHEPVQPVFNFIKNESGFKYFLSIRNKNNDIKLFNQNYVIISQLPCIVLLGKKLYQVENIDSKKLLPFFSKDLISVPPARVREYMETFVKNAILNYPVKIIGFKLTEIQANPLPNLILEKNLAGQNVLKLVFNYNNELFEYGNNTQSSVILEENDEGFYYLKFIRNKNLENSFVNRLQEFGFKQETNSLFKLSDFEGENNLTGNQLINWLNRNIELLRNEGFAISKAKAEIDYFIEPIYLDVDIKEVNDWFDVKAIVKLGEFQFPFIRFRRHIIMGIREFTLPNNQLVLLPEEWFTKYREIFIFGNDDDNGTIKLKRHHFQVLREAIGAQTGEMLAKLGDKLDLANVDDFKIPEDLTAELRDYQKKGVYWMFQLYNNKMGGCLADDMGLGKTLQTIALLLKVRADTLTNVIIPESKKPATQLSLFDIPAFTGARPINTSLIVMPVSLLHNWENEIAKFAPTLKTYKFFGTQRTRNFNDLLNVDVVLASYGVVRNDYESLAALNFKYVILDESQSIKNPDSKIYKAVIELQSEHKLVLTGTPIENSLVDLWAQLNFLNRDLLKSQHYFREEFVVPIEKHNDEEKKRKLQIIINPFILRRKKEQVVKELPSLTEQVVYCDMTDEQQKIYEEEKSAVRNLIIDSIDKQGYDKSSIIILKALNRLRLLANHPILTIPEYIGESGKFEEIARSIENVISENHKVLIFSSYVKHLNLVLHYLDEKCWKYALLTGATKNRQKVIESFQTEDDKKVFLISLKAGGTGLNLTAADYVFIIDPWWNPAAENQAISRAHRIGQDKKVFVYRFLSRNTIEEKIQQLQQKKSAMADLFINSNNPFRSIKRDEIFDLFK